MPASVETSATTCSKGTASGCQQSFHLRQDEEVLRNGGQWTRTNHWEAKTLCPINRATAAITHICVVTVCSWCLRCCTPAHICVCLSVRVCACLCVSICVCGVRDADMMILCQNGVSTGTQQQKLALFRYLLLCGAPSRSVRPWPPAPNGVASKLDEGLRRRRRQAPGDGVGSMSPCWITWPAHQASSSAANTVGGKEGGETRGGVRRTTTTRERYPPVRSKAASTISSTERGRWCP